MTTETTENSENIENVQEELNVTLTVTVSEANVILGALQELPHRVVNALIKKLIEQGNSQIAN
jgi:hypothetical protein